MTKKKRKEFAWDNETMVKEIEVNDYEKRVVSITELNNKQYVCVATHKKIKGEFKPVKNATFPKDVWAVIVEAVQDFDLSNAFGSTTELKAPKKDKKKEPVLKGKKLTPAERLAGNENWENLSKDKQEKALEQVTAFHEEYGMVSIGISKTNFFVVYGKGQQDAEKEIKKTKGFSRSKITHIL